MKLGTLAAVVTNSPKASKHKKRVRSPRSSKGASDVIGSPPRSPASDALYPPPLPLTSEPGPHRPTTPGMYRDRLTASAKQNRRTLSGIQKWTAERLHCSIDSSYSSAKGNNNCTITCTDNDDDREDERKANAEIEKILGATRPKHIGEGLTSGLGYIIQGAVGAAGIFILMPGVGAAEGKEKRGIVGGIIGGVGGMVGGVVHAANVMGGGLVTGVGQVVRGAVATPSAVIAPAKGKWWNANEGKWVLTNLAESCEWIETQPFYDQDILGDNVIPESNHDEPIPNSGDEDKRNDTNEDIDHKTSAESEKEDAEAVKQKEVKDSYYYDIMNLDPSVDSAMIKRRYYILARKYEPDRCGANSKALQDFQEISTAYTVLTNDLLREKYDRVGRAGLWEDDTTQQELPPPDIDPFLLYAFLFGSEKFVDYFGRLAAATSARVGQEEYLKISLSKARMLQKRRVTRLALQLADRLKVWAEDEDKELAQKQWMEEIEYLKQASYGIELIKVIGKVYSLAATQFLGSIESGIGMPSISRWAKKQFLTLKTTTETTAKKVKNVAGEMDKLTLSSTVATAIDKCDGDAELEGIAKKVLKTHLQSKVLKKLWTQTVVDITTTIHEASQMVLHDQNVSASVRKRRGKGLEALGKLFQRAQRTVNVVPEQEGLEEVAFFAMLDTVWRQEAMSRGAQQAEHTAGLNNINLPLSLNSLTGGV